MLVYVDFNMFVYNQTLIVFDENNEEITRTFASVDNLPKRIVETCHTFNVFDVKFNDETFSSKVEKEVSIIEKTQYNLNKIKFI